jgi:hypothetical protein
MQLYHLFLLTTLANALPGYWPHPEPSGFSVGSAAYFLEDDPSGNNIVSLHITSDGHLADPVRTPTGGAGSLMVNSTGFQNTADPLGSQGSVIVDGEYLFTVNAGSNTLSMFAIDPWNPLHPRLIGSPVDTLGEFPVSVDYSAKIQQACVLNGGAVAGVACFSVDPYKGVKASGPLRKLSAKIINETTPPSGPPGSAAQVLFNPDSSALFATVKGNPGSKPVQSGSFSAWPVVDGLVCEEDAIVTQDPNIILNFGFSFVDESTIFLSDPSFGTAFLGTGGNLSLAEETHLIIPDQVAVCWTQYWQPSETLYAIDAGINQIHTINASTRTLETPIIVTGMGTSANVSGVFDSAVNNGLMYSLLDTNGISVVDLVKKEQVQYLDLEGFGQRQYYTGMATWPSW